MRRWRVRSVVRQCVEPTLASDAGRASDAVIGRVQCKSVLSASSLDRADVGRRTLGARPVLRLV